MWGKQRKDRGSRVYICANNHESRRDPNNHCDCKRIPADIVEQRVWAEVEKLLSDPNRLMALAAEFLEQRGDQMVSEKESLGSLQRKIDQLDKARTQQAAAALKEGLDPALLKAAIAQLDDELAVLRRRATQLKAWREDNAGNSRRLQQLVELTEQAHLRLADLSPRRSGSSWTCSK